MTELSLRGRIAWASYWSQGHNNIRYSALLQRFPFVHQIKWRTSERWPIQGIQQRLENSILQRTLRKPQLRKLAYRYDVLWCNNDWQIPFFPGPIIFDDDDPTFASDRINMLNACNVKVVVTTTTFLQKALIKNGLRKPCKVIPSGIELRLLNSKRIRAISNRLGKLENRFVVGFAAPFLYMEGDRQVQSQEGKLRSLGYLLSVMELVWAVQPNVELWLFGHPSRALRNAVSQEERIRLLGYIDHDDILNYYSNLDLALYPRKVDMQGRHSIKLLEYLASGVPVVSTDVTESFHVRAAGAGLIVDGEDAFADAIVQLLHDQSTREAMSERGRSYAAEFDWNTVAQKYIDEVFREYA